MAIARTGTELRRWRDLAIIQRAFSARMPELQERVGLKEVAELCRRHDLTHPRDWNDVRDAMLRLRVLGLPGLVAVPQHAIVRQLRTDLGQTLRTRSPAGHV